MVGAMFVPPPGVGLPPLGGLLLGGLVVEAACVAESLPPVHPENRDAPTKSSAKPKDALTDDSRRTRAKLENKQCIYW
jgi:hypothetical protein